MQKNIFTVELNSWISNFSKNPEMPFVTNSALIRLTDLEAFIAEIKKKQADCVRVYFLRFRNDDIPTAPVVLDGKLAEGCKWKEASPGFTQASIALVPAKNFKCTKDFIYSANDIAEGNQSLVLMPGTEGEGTGICPPCTTSDE